jgi:integrase
LQWKDIDFSASLLTIRRSKTPAAWRTPTLNAACTEVLAGLYQAAMLINGTSPEHYVFPWQGGKGKIDPTRPMAGWRTAWRTILKQADVKARFHDLRHTAVTTMAEAGLPDLTIMAQVVRLTHDDEALLAYQTTGFESGGSSTATPVRELGNYGRTRQLTMSYVTIHVTKY